MPYTQLHLDIDDEPRPPHAEELVQFAPSLLRSVEAVVADRLARRLPVDWSAEIIRTLVAHPDEDERVELARHTTSLIAASALAGDRSPKVRASLCRNPLARDADLQLTLAGDADHRVVLVLIDNVGLSRPALLAILERDPHRLVLDRVAELRVSAEVRERIEIHLSARRQLPGEHTVRPHGELAPPIASAA